MAAGVECPARRMLDDILEPDLALVVCGTAVGAESARRGHYYAGPGNSFWHTLHVTGLTAELLTSERDRELLRYGIGLTDIAKRRSGTDDKLTRSDYDVPGFRARIAEYRPGIVCFNGKGAAKVAFDTQSIDYGQQPEPIAESVAFVAPSTSGAARGYWDVDLWYQVARLAKALA